LRSVAVPICYDPPGNRINRGDRDNLPRVTPWRRRESRSEVADADGPLSVGQSTRLSASGKEASAQPLAAAGPHGTEDEAPRKKARLGWGQGLAKYEKQKVQGPSDPAEVVADVSSGDGEQKTSLAPAPSVASVFPAAPLPESAPAPPAALALSSAPMRCSSPVTAPPYCSSGMQPVLIFDPSPC
jgi:hypothetical protein